jgi:hypothetical protein
MLAGLDGLGSDDARQSFVNQLQMTLFTWIEQNPSLTSRLYVLDGPSGSLSLRWSVKTACAGRGAFGISVRRIEFDRLESISKLALQCFKPLARHQRVAAKSQTDHGQVFVCQSLPCTGDFLL